MNYEEVRAIIEQMREERFTNYLYQFNKNLDEKNFFTIWLEYKYPYLNKENNCDYPDLDVSKMAILTYCRGLRVYDSQKYGKIYEEVENQQGCKQMYSIKLKSGVEMRGDWLTSPLHIIKLYMGLLWESESKERSGVYKEYTSLFEKTTKGHLLCAPRGTWVEYCYENSDVIWKTFDEEARTFMKNVVSAGNFISMPIYVNPCRCKKFGKNDTLDTLMWKLYCCFRYKMQYDEGGLNEYLSTAFCGEHGEEARKNVISWMQIYNNSWDEFVRYNYMTNFVEKDGNIYGKPIDLRTGKAIDLEIGAEYNPLPADIATCRKMLKNYNDLVNKRTKDIYNNLLKNGEF